jgi:hypothetical protein
MRKDLSKNIETRKGPSFLSYQAILATDVEKIKAIPYS